MTPPDRPRMPRAVWVLGFVSLFMDMSSELVHAVLPVYLTSALGLSVLAVGVIEGIAEATASMMKLVSGVVSDRYAARKPLVLLGYGLAALTKPVFPLADGAGGVVAARFVDRLGKGIRGAPRDALVADVTPADLRDAAYGLRQALDTVGAFIGPLLAMGLIVWWAGDLRAVLWAASVPAAIAVALLAVGLDEPPRAAAPARARQRWRWSSLRTLPPAFWGLVVLAALFAVARLAEAFLVLRAQELSLRLALIPLVMIVMSALLRGGGLPRGAAGRTPGPPRAARGGAVGAGRLVRGPGRMGPRRRALGRSGALRAAPGADAGRAVGRRRSRRTGVPARHGLRCLPLRHRRVPARRGSPGGVAVDRAGLAKCVRAGGRRGARRPGGGLALGRHDGIAASAGLHFRRRPVLLRAPSPRTIGSSAALLALPCRLPRPVGHQSAARCLRWPPSERLEGLDEHLLDGWT